MRMLSLAMSVAVSAPIVSMSPATATSRTASAQALVDDLLATDLAFAVRGQTGMIDAFAAMFDADVIVPIPGGKFAHGRDPALAAIKANPDNATAKASWTPVRGAISADGRHGFTFGYMTVTRANAATVPVKYLAYWLKRPEGWRVAAYKRAGRPAGEVSMVLMPASLPPHLVTPTGDAAVVAGHRAGLIAAERAFSDRAQKIGIGPAFAATGRPDSMNMGRESQFAIGSQAIGAGFEPGKGSPVNWNADDALVASSGDLGVTFGTIRSNADTNAPPSAFFTIWRRDGGKGEWRYIAE